MGVYPDNIAARSTYEKIKYAKSGVLAGVFDKLPKKCDDCVKVICAEMDQLKERIRSLEKRG